MADISHEIKIRAPQDRVYAALTTLASLRSWHTAKIEGGANVGDVFVTRPQRGPEFEWKVVGADKSRHVEWKCVKGPGQSTRTSVGFDLSSLPDGRTYLEFSHSDWPDTGGNFRKCNTLWGVLLHHLRKYAETQQTDPAFT